MFSKLLINSIALGLRPMQPTMSARFERRIPFASILTNRCAGNLAKEAGSQSGMRLRVWSDVGHSASHFALGLFQALILFVGLLSAGAVPLHAQTATTSTVAIGGPGVGMVQAGDGNFYSPSLPTYVACANDPTQICSYIYKMTQAGVASVFHPFSPTPNTTVNADGLAPTALIVGTDGNLYGACKYGGTGGLGTIFEITLKGDFTILKTFTSNGKTLDPGYQPLDLVQGNDGNFYFTNGLGIYELTPAGTASTVTTLFTFSFDVNSSIFPDGGNANSMVQGSDGNFYLTLLQAPNTVSGQGTQGAIAKFNPITKVLSTVHILGPDGSEGDHPDGPLVEASDGTFYGIAEYSQNATTGQGIAFEVSPGGTYSIVHQFPGGTVGGYSIYESTLTLGSDGNLYGTTLLGGDTASKNCTPNGCGTNFQMATAGTYFASLHSFEGGIPTSTVVSDNPLVDGASPATPLVQTSDGSFYGTTLGGTMSGPTVFQTSFNPALSAPVQLSLDHSKINIGDSVNLTWKVLNAFSLTAQQCGANIVGNPAGAGTWSGPQAGQMVNGVYSGGVSITPTAAGTYTYSLTCGGKESGFVPLVVLGNPPLQIQTMSLLDGTVSQMYLESLNATGGMLQYHWSVSGTLPKGITFDPTDGSFIGKPLQYGQYPLMISVQDSTMPVAEMASISLVLTVNSGLSMFKTLPNAIVAQSYPQGASVGAGGGLPPYTFQLTSGALPPGLTFNSTTGGISGTPTTAGTYSFTVFLTDSEDLKAQTSQTFSLIVAPPTLQITSGLLPVGSVGAPYSTTLMATGGMPPYYWSFGTNSPAMGTYQPPGLALSTATGVLSGIPTQFTPALSNSFTYDLFNVVVKDSENPPVMVSATVELGIRRTLQITTTSIPIGVVGTTTMTQLAASGGIPPYKWAVTCDCGSLTPMQIGLSLTGDGSVLTEAPNQPINTTVTITVQDSELSPPDQVQLAQPLIFLPVLLPTTTALSSSNTTSGTGETLTLTANVVQTGGGPATGQVMIFNGTALLGTALLDTHGNATLQTSFSATGVYSLTAVYGGNGTLAGSTSAALTETVITPTISASFSPNSLTIQSGKSGQLVITLTPVGGYSGTVQFSCGTLPAHVSCAFAPPNLTITAGSGPVTDTLTVTTSAPLTSALLKPGIGKSSNGFFYASILWFPGSLVALLGLIRRNRGGPSRGDAQFLDHCEF